jgi:hypothetical protein
MLEEMKMNKERRPRGYWKVFENVENELRQVIEVLGHFPTTKELRHMIGSKIGNIMSEYHGGLSAVRERMGYEPNSNKKPPGYWKEWENIEKELRPIIQEAGEFPKQKQLIRNGHSSLAVSIVKYHGGLSAVRERLGYKERGKLEETCDDIAERSQEKSHEEGSRRPSGFFEKMSDEEIMEYTHRLYGKDVSKKELREKDSSLLITLGKRKLRSRLKGVRKRKLPNGYWQKWDNLEKELKSIIISLGHFPTEKYFLERGESGLLSTINKNYGGLPAVRERMGVSQENQLELIVNSYVGGKNE